MKLTKTLRSKVFKLANHLVKIGVAKNISVALKYAYAVMLKRERTIRLEYRKEYKQFVKISTMSMNVGVSYKDKLASLGYTGEIKERPWGHRGFDNLIHHKGKVYLDGFRNNSESVYYDFEGVEITPQHPLMREVIKQKSKTSYNDWGYLTLNFDKVYILDAA